MSVDILEQVEGVEASEQERPEVWITAHQLTDPASAQPGQACHPVLIRRWRNGQVIWEGLPEEYRLMRRRYPKPVERARLNGEDGH